MSTASARMVDEDFALFTAWCHARGARALPATADAVEAFLVPVPGARLRKLRTIRLAHETARMSVPDPAVLPSVRAREQGWVTLARAIAQLPTLRCPTGMRGRRDGWLMLLVGELGLTYRDAGELHKRPPFPRRGGARTCPACVSTRWLRVLGPAWYGDRAEVRDLLDPRGADLDVHDCDTPLDERWRDAPTLLPAIDQHGWMNAHRPLSRSSVGTILNARRLPAADPAGPTAARVRVTVTAEDRQALADAFDEVNARLDALIADAEAALQE